MRYAAIILTLVMAGCSGISPLDRAVIVAGCDSTIKQAAAAEANPNTPTGELDLWRQFDFKAKHLKAWAQGEPFPDGAVEVVK